MRRDISSSQIFFIPSASLFLTNTLYLTLFDTLYLPPSWSALSLSQTHTNYYTFAFLFADSLVFVTSPMDAEVLQAWMATSCTETSVVQSETREKEERQTAEELQHRGCNEANCILEKMNDVMFSSRYDSLDQQLLSQQWCFATQNSKVSQLLRLYVMTTGEKESHMTTSHSTLANTTTGYSTHFGAWTRWHALMHYIHTYIK